MATTLKDIAAACGVSIGTVERALKGKGRINPEVAEKVRKVAKEMHYRPNIVAKGLVNRSRKYKIAVVLHIQGNDFYDTVMAGVRSAANEILDYGIETQIYPCPDFDAEAQVALIDQALADGASALAIVPIDAPAVIARVARLHESGFPVVFLTAFLPEPTCLCSIHCDYYRSGRIGASLLQYLAGPGSRVLACMPSYRMLGNHLRKDGVLDFIRNPECPMELVDLVELTNNTEKDAELISQQVRLHPEIDSLIYCGNAKSAQLVLQDRTQIKHAVFYDLSPEIRDLLLNGSIDAAITQSPEEQGHRAIMVLFQYITGHTVPPEVVLFDSHIKLKESID